MTHAFVEPTDEQLMTRTQTGDAAAFGLLFDRLGGSAYGVAHAIVRDRGRSDEVVHDAFLAAWRGREGYDPAHGPPRAWVLGFVRRRAIATLPRGRRTRARSGIHRDGVLALPDAQREVLALAVYGELSVPQIAGALAVPDATVKDRMRLGLTELRAAGAADAPR